MVRLSKDHFPSGLDHPYLQQSNCRILYTIYWAVQVQVCVLCCGCTSEIPVQSVEQSRVYSVSSSWSMKPLVKACVEVGWSKHHWNKDNTWRTICRCWRQALESLCLHSDARLAGVKEDVPSARACKGSMGKVGLSALLGGSCHPLKRC